MKPIARRRLFYTPQVIATIKAMVGEGKSNAEIALAIGTKENLLQSRLSQFGIRRSRQFGDLSLGIRLPQAVWAKYEAAAKARHVNLLHLVRAMMHRIADDNLFDAILDDRD